MTGRTREIYQHPDCPELLVKVMRNDQATKPRRLTVRLPALISTDGNENAIELHNFQQVRSKLQPYLTDYHSTLHATSLGPGLVCSKVLDHTGDVSLSLADWMQHDRPVDWQIGRAFSDFFQRLFDQNCYFFDFNPRNFLLQQLAGGLQLKYIDLKSYRRDRSLLPLGRLSQRAARQKMSRRMQRLQRRCLEPALS